MKRIETVVEAIDKLRDTSNSHHRCSIVEVMGNRCGDLALWSGIACGAEIIVTSETGFDEEDVLEDIKPQAEERVKLNLILEAIIKEEELAVTDEEREAELQKIADMYQRELDDVKKIFEGNMSHVENDILTRKAIDLVKDNLKK